MNNSVLNIFKDENNQLYFNKNELYKNNLKVQEEYENKIDILLDGLFFDNNKKKDDLN